MKKILVVYYSQTGQLLQLAQNFVHPLEAAGMEIEWCAIEPQQPYAFPWGFFEFFNTFPETVHLQPKPIVSPVLASEKYDVVVLAYTVWFLSPAQPITAFLQSPVAAKILRDTPVITLIGCRNMWLNAQETVKRFLQQHGARLVGNIVKIDACGSAASFITTPAWLLTGKKEISEWLPAAGIAPEELQDGKRFGAKLAQILGDDLPLDETLFQNMGAVRIDENLIFGEQAARRSFHIWGKLLMAAGRKSAALRKVLVYVYVLFLILMILTIVPLGALVRKILKIKMRDKLEAKKAYYAAPSGE